MPLYLLLVAVVMLSCILLNKISSRLGIPMLLAFILLGMLFGSDGVVKIPFDNYSFAEQVCSVALIFIMFYGGFGTNWNEAKPVAAKAILLSSLGVVITAGLVGLFCHFVMGISWLESLLIGSVIGSTDAASVFSILRSKRLNLRYNTASLLEVESGSNDPCAYMLTVIVLSVMQGNASGGSIGYMLFAQLFFGVVFGVGISAASIWLLHHVRFNSSGFDAIFVTAIALLSYAAPAALGGNGFLSAYIVGIVLGNSDIQNKKTLVPFFDALTGMMQMLIFFLLGLLSFPSRLLPAALPALAIALFLTFIARPLAVSSILSAFPALSRLRKKSAAPAFNFNQQLVVSWAGLRGAASIVFAIMAVMAVETENDIFHIVFCIVLFSILLQGSLLPYISGRLNMIDESADVMKTFSDYSSEIPVDFIQFKIAAGHPWCGSLIKDILLPPDTLLVMLRRGSENVVPNGNTMLLDGDKLVLSARASGNIHDVHLSEKTIYPSSKLVGKRLRDLKNEKNDLVILIMRGDRIIIPNGNTILHIGDIIVINHTDDQSPDKA